MKYNKLMFTFREDVSTAEEAFHSDEEKEAYYSELKAAAESGWDFSSRWFIHNATNKGECSSVNPYFYATLTLRLVSSGVQHRVIW
jgi:alpha,alpha-trehalase